MIKWIVLIVALITLSVISRTARSKQRGLRQKKKEILNRQRRQDDLE